MIQRENYLSRRLTQVFEYLVSSDLPGKEIAYTLGITHSSFKTYTSHLYSQFDVKGRIELAYKWNNGEISMISPNWMEELTLP